MMGEHKIAAESLRLVQHLVAQVERDEHFRHGLIAAADKQADVVPLLRKGRRGEVVENREQVIDDHFASLATRESISPTTADKRPPVGQAFQAIAAARPVPILRRRPDNPRRGREPRFGICRIERLRRDPELPCATALAAARRTTGHPEFEETGMLTQLDRPTGTTTLKRTWIVRSVICVVAAAVVGGGTAASVQRALADPLQLAPVYTNNPPAIEFPNNALAVGAGANPVITTVPQGLWDRMTGYSWTQGCPVGRNDLRVVSVNFWGFDGVRSRGSLVVRYGQGDNVAAIFTKLYDQTFRIRRMEPMAEQFGKTIRNGVTYPGSDDAEAMRKDNTSAFNCRYKTFDENEHVWSPHRCGAAIDINPWENPEEEFDNGVLQGYHPDQYHFDTRTGVGKFTSGDPQVKALDAKGYSTWGGNWNETDYMHFQNDNFSSC